MTGEMEAGPVETGAPPAPPAGGVEPGREPETFEEMGLRPEVQQALGEMGFLDPMPVQRAVYARMMAGRDVMVQSRTGSGKTAAFGIPFAQGLIDPAEKQVQALVLAPTRELALQVAQECGKIGQYRGLSVVPIYGGAPMQKQIEQLKAGAHVVAGTPGRVLDHLRRGTLTLGAVKVLVLDEADEMLSMGFLEEITEIIKRCPPKEVRQTTLFSATIPEDIERIGSRYMKEPEKIMLSADFVGAREIHHAYYMVSGMGKNRDLVRVLEVERPESAIIFCNTREETSFIAEYLKKNGLDAEAISSDLTQRDRERVMGRMKEKNLRFLVATDIAARGIDISDLSHVINYTFPESAEVYVHRTGRTGRAGKSGTAISIISPRELGNFYMLKLTYKIKPEERQLPSEDEWKTVREAAKVDELKQQMGAALPEAEWIAVAKRLWASEDGEKYVAALIRDRLQPERRRAGHPDPTAAAIPSAPEPARPAEPARATEPSREAREPAREGRDGETTPRDGERSRRRRRGRGREESRGRERRENGVTRKSEPAQKRSPVGGTIDDSDGREFWEAWVDSKTEPGPAPEPEPVEARTQAPARREREPERAPLQPGQVRLYLNLGRRDGLREPELSQLLAERGVSGVELQVFNSHTYVIAPEANEAAICAALTGQKHGDRDLVCERARR